jgi:DnaJ-class molecular chaperone
MTSCPECKGKGKYFSRRLLNTTEGCRYQEGIESCDTCRGEGSISEEHAARIEEGERRRKDRISRRVSLIEEAKVLGISASVLSDIEHGRIREPNNA